MSLCIFMNFIFQDELYYGFIERYGDVLDVVLRVSLWMDLYRGRIVGLIWYPRRGWCAGVSSTTIG